ncbi:MAG: glycosyl hydrolase [Roseiflexaceae bacterium]|nr:glycosyl hydrolase [Roseiflexaceae bacterium]
MRSTSSLRIDRILSIVVTTALLLAMLPAVAPSEASPVISEPLRTPLRDSPFGVNSHLATRYWDPASMHVPADIVARLGVGWVREDFHWFRIQPAPDVPYDWTFTDEAVRALSRRGLNILGVIGHPPGWATPFPGDIPHGVSFYAPDPQQFAAFAAAVAQRYRNYIFHWEIWNEPDNPLFWKPAPDPVAYATLLRLAATAIRLVNPQATILIGGIYSFEPSFLRQVAAADAWESFDILAIHPYVSPSAPEIGNLVAGVEAARSVAEQYGARPIWVTEIGWSSGHGDRDAAGLVNEQDQANFLVRATLLLWRAGVEKIFWYTLKDDPGNPYGLVGLGVGYFDYSRLKPSFTAYRVMVEYLSGADLVVLRDLFTRTAVLDFERFGAWRRGDQAYGDFTPSSSQVRSGRGAAELRYAFSSRANEFVVFRRERPAPIPDSSYALGMWVYGDGSGNTLKVWVRDAEGEVLQFALGVIGPPGWRILEAPIAGIAPEWDRISGSGNGRVDFPARLDAVVLDDLPDAFAGGGVVYLDDLFAISGPEAYDAQFQRGDTTIDVLWAPTPVRASIRTGASTATLVTRDGATSTINASEGRLVLDLGPAPIYVVHRR